MSRHVTTTSTLHTLHSSNNIVASISSTSDRRSVITSTPLAQTDMYFVTFESCNPTIGSHWLTHTMKITVSLLLADTVCKHSHSLLLLVQHKKLVTTAHEQCAMTRGAGWEHNFCQFERGVSRQSLMIIVLRTQFHVERPWGQRLFSLVS